MGRGAYTVIGSSQRAPTPLAALANGALAHGLDFDDTRPVSITHASAVVLPTVLALGEAVGRDGRSVVTAAVAGYEAIARLGMAAPGAFHTGGWHATAVCGTFAATLAAGRLEGLDERRLTAALGIAGSFASGVNEYLEDGSWVNRVHPGWAAHGGIVAAGLARGGFTGPATIRECRFGLYRTFLRREPDLGPVDTLGKEWETGCRPTCTRERIGDERVLALASRVDHTVDPASRFTDGFPGWVRVRLRDGRIIEAREPDGRGGAGRRAV